MTRTIRGVTATALAAGLVLGGLGLGMAEAQPAEFAATMELASDEGTMTMDYSVAPGKMRMDMPQQMSVVWTSGDTGGMLMIQHAERRYIEWGPDQMKMMREMMGRMPQRGGGGDSREVDIANIRFERTGRTETIGAWDAFEVRVTGVQGVDAEEMHFWMSTGPEIGMMEIGQSVAQAADALNMPMMQAGGGGGAQAFLRYRSMARAQGLPDGRVVRVHAVNDGEPTTITLMRVDAGELPAGTFEAPDGYEAMQMPSIPGLPE